MSINKELLLAANIYPAKKVDGQARKEAHKEILEMISTIVETYGDYLEKIDTGIGIHTRGCYCYLGAG